MFFLHNMLCSDNSIIVFVMRFAIKSDEYFKLCDFADVSLHDSIHCIKRRIKLKFIAVCRTIV